MTEREHTEREDEIDMLFMKANFAAEDRGFRERLRARLLAYMKEMRDGAELGEKEFSGLAAAGSGFSYPCPPEKLPGKPAHPIC